MAEDLRPPALEGTIAREVGLDEVEPVLEAILQGRVRGRTIVRIGGEQ